MEKNVKILKSVATKTFEVALVEANSGYYYILYEVQDKVTQSESIKDFAIASFLYDAKLRELEGH